MKEAAATASAMQRAQYYERHTRHGVVKCYREFVVGRYVCRRYGWW
jgi:RNase P/RNase MRP subunit POP5